MRDRNPPKYEKGALDDLLQNKEQIVLHRTHFDSLADLDNKLYMAAENYFNACGSHPMDNMEAARQVQTWSQTL